jgi:hypothetical protein
LTVLQDSAAISSLLVRRAYFFQFRQSNKEFAMRPAQLVLTLGLAAFLVGSQPVSGEAWWPFGQPVRAVKKVGSGTKRALVKTGQTLTFQSDPEPSQFSAWKGEQEYRRTGAKEEKPGFFASLFKPAEPPHPSKTIKDFMSQERVQP